MLYFARGSKNDVISDGELRSILTSLLNSLPRKRRVLAIPPDHTRLNSYAGPITKILFDNLGDALTDIMPALGTHVPMNDEQLDMMFEGIPHNLFRVHDWRNDVTTIGQVPKEYIEEISEGKLSFSWPAQVNRKLLDKSYDVIFSIGQVVPHEVIGMANYNKNIFVGVGGVEGINKSHYLGAIYGMERIMGRAKTPVRDILEYASTHFATDIPIIYIQTVLSRGEDGAMKLRGLFIGDDFECFQRAAELSLQTNFTMLDRAIKKCIVYLDPKEFASTWLGNKSIYRTRMALADEGELIVLAPALREFGEDKRIDQLIRKYGYSGTPSILKAVEENADLRENLSAAAHLIHGSSEGRFTITYSPGNGVSREEIESVNYNYAPLSDTLSKYNVENLKDGWNEVNGEDIFYISNPALGLWATADRFKD